MNNLKHTIEYLDNVIKELKKLEDERDSRKIKDHEERGIKKTMDYIDMYAEKIVVEDIEGFEHHGYKLSKKLLEDALKQM